MDSSQEEGSRLEGGGVRLSHQRWEAPPLLTAEGGFTSEHTTCTCDLILQSPAHTPYLHAITYRQGALTRQAALPPKRTLERVPSNSQHFLKRAHLGTSTWCVTSHPDARRLPPSQEHMLTHCALLLRCPNLTPGPCRRLDPGREVRPPQTNEGAASTSTSSLARPLSSGSFAEALAVPGAGAP